MSFTYSKWFLIKWSSLRKYTIFTEHRAQLYKHSVALCLLLCLWFISYACWHEDLEDPVSEKTSGILADFRTIIHKNPALASGCVTCSCWCFLPEFVTCPVIAFQFSQYNCFCLYCMHSVIISFYTCQYTEISNAHWVSDLCPM